MNIYLDFDGTVVLHKFPKTGELIEECVDVLSQFTKKGYKIILNTLRCEFEDGSLEKAIEFLKENNIHIDSVAINKLNPGKWDLELFKANQFVIIDDFCEEIPLSENSEGHRYVNWLEVQKQLNDIGI
jgi:anion-transporting  ArsA/GET3 family ATPase